MSNNLHRCVVDIKGYYVEIVLVNIIKNQEVPEGYELQEGERLVNLPPPDWGKGKLNSKEDGWEDIRTPEEIEASKEDTAPAFSSQTLRQLEAEQALMEVAELIAETQEALFELAGGMQHD